MQKIIAAIMAFFTMLGSLFGIGTKQKEIVVQADKAILAHFEGTMTPEEILDDVSKVDLNHTMNKKGLTEKAVGDNPLDSVLMYYDKNGKLVYESYENFGENYFIYYTKSKSGAPIEVGYSMCYSDKNQRDVNIKADKYSAYFCKTDKKADYRAQEVYLTAKGEKFNYMTESITYAYEDNIWYANAEYVADDGFHSYTHYYDYATKKYEDFDSIIFENRKQFSLTDVQSMLDFYGNNVYEAPELFMSQAPFYSEKDGKVKWYYQGKITFFFGSSEQAEAFAEKFGYKTQINPSTDYDPDEAEKMPPVVVVDNVIIPFAENAKNFSPYNYYDINDAYSATPSFNNNYEILSLAGGTIQYY